MPLHRLPAVRFRQPWTVLQARRELRRLIAEQQFDVVVSNGCWSHAVFASAVRAARVPLVYWVHDAHDGRHWLERLASYSPPDLAIANSRFTESKLSNLFRAMHSDVIYYPVQSTAAGSRPVIRQEKRSEFGTSLDEVVVVQTCRLERWKGHQLLLEALGRLRDVGQWRCWIAGGAQRPHEAAYLNELKQYAAEAGISQRVQFIGQRSDVPELLQAADIHCQPNMGPEPFGIAFIEALYAGLPVVTTNLGAAPEIVDDTCGRLVATSSAALADVLRELIADAELRMELGSAAPARARELCDPASQITRFYEALQDVSQRVPMAHGCPGR